MGRIQPFLEFIRTTFLWVSPGEHAIRGLPELEFGLGFTACSRWLSLCRRPCGVEYPPNSAPPRITPSIANNVSHFAAVGQCHVPCGRSQLKRIEMSASQIVLGPYVIPFGPVNTFFLQSSDTVRLDAMTTPASLPRGGSRCWVRSG